MILGETISPTGPASHLKFRGYFAPKQVGLPSLHAETLTYVVNEILSLQFLRGRAGAVVVRSSFVISRSAVQFRASEPFSPEG